jgi:hypothetical protein
MGRLPLLLGGRGWPQDTRRCRLGRVGQGERGDEICHETRHVTGPPEPQPAGPVASGGRIAAGWRCWACPGAPGRRQRVALTRGRVGAASARAAGSETKPVTKQATHVDARRRRDGRARGHLAEYVRLGLGEDCLPQRGDRGAGRPARVAEQRLLAMTLLADASLREVVVTVAGNWPFVSWAKPWQAPGGEVLGRWRARLGEELFAELLARASARAAAEPEHTAAGSHPAPWTPTARRRACTGRPALKPPAAQPGRLLPIPRRRCGRRGDGGCRTGPPACGQPPLAGKPPSQAGRRPTARKT